MWCTRNKIILILILAQFQYSTSQQPERKIDPEVQKKIDDFVHDIFLPQAHVQGLGLGIMQNDGEILYTTGYGFSNIERGIRNGNQTQFGLGSASKGFSALVTVKILHEHFPDLGETVLDVPVVKLAPSVNITFIDRFRSEHLTVRDLLAQRHCFFADWTSIQAESITTRQEVVYRQRYLKQLCDFRSNVTYSNSMVAMAGEIAATLANKPFETLAQEMFAALGMNQSTFIKETDVIPELTGRAQPYYVIDDQPHPFNPDMVKRIIPVNPAGGLFATPNDIMRYLQFILQRGSLDGKQIVPREVIEWLMRPSNIWELPAYKSQENDKQFNEFAYGLGWVISSYDGWELIQHGGGYAPYSAMLSIFPAKNLVVFSAIHEGPERLRRITLPLFIFETLHGSGTTNASEIAIQVGESRMIDRKLGESPYDLKNSKMISEKIEKAFSLSKAGLIPGLYGNGAMGDLVISEIFNSTSNQTEYYVEYGKWYKGWLHEDPRAPGILYTVELETDIWHDFVAYGYPSAIAFLLVTPNADVPAVAFLAGSNDLSVVVIYEEFVFGAGLDALPVIPWEPDSCGIPYA